jgi:hypothetical protein
MALTEPLLGKKTRDASVFRCFSDASPEYHVGRRNFLCLVVNSAPRYLA